MTTLIRPSVQRSLDLIPLYAAAVMAVVCAECLTTVPADKGHVCPNTDYVDGDCCAQGTCDLQPEHITTRWCDCVVGYQHHKDALKPLVHLRVITFCGDFHENTATAMRDLQRALTVAGEPLWI